MTLSYRLLLLLTGLLLIIAMLYAIVIGPSDIHVSQVVQILLNLISGQTLDGTLASVEAWQQTVVYQVRLPRVLSAALVGASLAVCGVVLQGLFRNPLASPSILGVSSGASLGAVVAIFLGISVTSLWGLPLMAFIGASVTLLLVYQIATHRGQTPVATLLLSGVAVSSFNIAMTSLVLALSLQNWEVGKAITYWTMGGLDGRGWHHVLLLMPVFLICWLVMLTYQKELDIMLVGEIHASAVGVDVHKVRLHLLLLTALLIAAAVSVAGGIGFIGLVVPHMCQLLTGPYHQRLLPLSALLGALLLVIADIAVRGNASYAVIPLGVVTATLGAPFFLFLLFKQRHLLRAS